MRKLIYVVATAVFTLIILSGCGSGPTLTYQITGTGEQAEIAYRDRHGNLQLATVSLPWRENLRVEDDFSYEINVQAVDSPGVACTVLLDDEELGTITGTTFAECRGRIAGGRASFEGRFDKPLDD